MAGPFLARHRGVRPALASCWLVWSPYFLFFSSFFFFSFFLPPSFSGSSAFSVLSALPFLTLQAVTDVFAAVSWLQGVVNRSLCMLRVVPGRVSCTLKRPPYGPADKRIEPRDRDTLLLYEDRPSRMWRLQPRPDQAGGFLLFATCSAPVPRATLLPFSHLTDAAPSLLPRSSCDRRALPFSAIKHTTGTGRAFPPPARLRSHFLHRLPHAPSLSARPGCSIPAIVWSPRRSCPF